MRIWHVVTSWFDYLFYYDGNQWERLNHLEFQKSSFCRLWKFHHNGEILCWGACVKVAESGVCE